MKTSTTCRVDHRRQYTVDSFSTRSTDPFDIDERTILIVDELSRELCTVVGVDAGDVLKERGVVGSVVDTLGVDDNLGELSSLGEARDDLVRDVCTEVDRESEGHVVSPDDVSEFFTALDLRNGLKVSVGENSESREQQNGPCLP